MKESTWKECVETNTSLKVSSDKQKAKFLVETAKEAIQKCVKLIEELDSLLIKKIPRNQ